MMNFYKPIGRREKEFDQAVGKTAVEVDNDLADTDTEILQELYDDAVVAAADAEDDGMILEKTPAPAAVVVKVANFKYTTTASDLKRWCASMYGPVTSIHLLRFIC